MKFCIEIKQMSVVRRDTRLLMDTSMMQNFQVIELFDKLSTVGVFINGNFTRKWSLV
jgi:hypothetical protein